MTGCNHSLCCESASEERSAGNPHATFRGDWGCQSRSPFYPGAGVRFPHATQLTERKPWLPRKEFLFVTARPVAQVLHSQLVSDGGLL